MKVAVQNWRSFLKFDVSICQDLPGLQNTSSLHVDVPNILHCQPDKIELDHLRIFDTSDTLNHEI